jgi:hypothetical protein
VAAKLNDNAHQIEIFQGPLLAPIHVTAVGGAYVAFAQDTEGSAVNAASPAVRDPYSLTWFDYDVTVGVSAPGLFGGHNTDFDNPGNFSHLSNPLTGGYLDLNFGGTLQFGELGVAATGDLEQFSLTTATQGNSGLTMQLGRWKALGAYGFFDGQLVLGAGARILTMQIQQDKGPTLLTMTGAAPEVGALYMPTGFQFRFGAAARAAVSGNPFGSENAPKDAAGVERVANGTFALPSSVTLPWEVDMGIAYQLGPRPLNPGWENPHDQEAWLRRRITDGRAERALFRDAEIAAVPPAERPRRAAELDAEENERQASEDQELADASKKLFEERKARYENWPRERILLLASVLLSGPSHEAISLEGFLNQAVETVGQKLTATPRLGLEGEPLRDRMILRVGTYVEPSRYEDVEPRQHFTFGGDVRLFPVDFWGLIPQANWKLAFFIDLAPRYQNYGLSIGNWH